MRIILTDEEIRGAIEQYVKTNVGSESYIKELNCKRGGKVEAVIELTNQNKQVELNKEQGE